MFQAKGTIYVHVLWRSLPSTKTVFPRTRLNPPCYDVTDWLDSPMFRCLLGPYWLLEGIFRHFFPVCFVLGGIGAAAGASEGWRQGTGEGEGEGARLQVLGGGVVGPDCRCWGGRRARLQVLGGVVGPDCRCWGVVGPDCRCWGGS